MTGPTPSDVLEYRRLLGEKLGRRIEALNLYEPLPVQAEFHACHSRARLLRGSNRSGKTLSTAVEVARAVTDRDPHGKYPSKDGRCYVIGKDEKHLGEVIYRKLFRAGAFRMIRDELTGDWRAYRPWLDPDRTRKRQSKPSLPLIPARYVKSVSWKSKSANVPEKVVLTNGWEMDFFSSNQKPPRGSDLDLVWLDEEIVDGDWYPEMSARLLDRGGVLIWGATPQTGSDRMYELHTRCEQEQELWSQAGFDPGKEPSAREFFISLEGNPHIDAKQKRELEKDLTDDEARVRIGGEYAIESSRVYPEWNVGVHGVDYFGVPETWTRYMVVDPGRQVCAVLFAAVPPPEAMIGDPGARQFGPVGPDYTVVLFDELYITACTAGLFGERVAAKTAGQDFEAFVIDGRGARLSDIGSGKTVQEQYERALEQNGVGCRRTGSRFIWGSDDVRGRTELVRGWLRVRACGWPPLLAAGVRDKLPNFAWEIQRYRYKRKNGITTDEPEDRGRVHLMACLGYLAAYAPVYVEPANTPRPPRNAYEQFRAKLARARKEGPRHVNLGPASREK